MEKMIIRKLHEKEAPPMELLLLADPSEKLVKEYLKKSICYVGEIDGGIVGQYLLMTKSDVVAELINIAVDPDHQNRGFGKQLVLNSIKQARKQGFKRIEVGTATIGTSQIKLYKKCGFSEREIWKGFFLDNYEDEIIDDGLQCIDMVRLAIDI